MTIGFKLLLCVRGVLFSSHACSLACQEWPTELHAAAEAAVDHVLGQLYQQNSGPGINPWADLLLLLYLMVLGPPFTHSHGMHRTFCLVLSDNSMRCSCDRAFCGLAYTS